MKPQLQQLADDVIGSAFGVDPATWPMTQLVYVGFMLLAAAPVFAFAANFAGIFIFFERRIASRMQARVGPNRVGPQGLLQFLADGLKCLFKEDLVPDGADHLLFRLSPYFVVTGMLLSFAAMPFTSILIGTDINIGILFVLGVTTLVVIGFLMGGWGSNSKWALLGGMRSAAQVVSYEVPAAMAVMTTILLAGSLSMQDLIKAQSGAPWRWAFFHSPFVAVSFFIYFAAGLAEGSRVPFDLPEAESELVSGYNTEYSGMRFLMFFLGEFANVWVLCAIAVALYFGGWQIPFARLEDGNLASWVSPASGWLLGAMMIGAALPAAAIGVQVARYRTRAHAAIEQARIPGAGARLIQLAAKGGVDGAIAVHLLGAVALVGLAFLQLGFTNPTWLIWRTKLAVNGLELGMFMSKTIVLVFIVIQLRWTLPRLRVDQMMTVCWKYMVPASLICVVGTMVWDLIIQALPALDYVMRAAMCAASIAVIYFYLRKIRSNFDADKATWEEHRGTPLYYPPWRLP